MIMADTKSSKTSTTTQKNVSTLLSTPPNVQMFYLQTGMDTLVHHRQGSSVTDFCWVQFIPPGEEDFF